MYLHRLGRWYKGQSNYPPKICSMVYIFFNLYNSDASRNQGKAGYVPAVDFIYRHLHLNMTYSDRITHVLPVCTIINPIFLTAVPTISANWTRQTFKMKQNQGSYLKGKYKSNWKTMTSQDCPIRTCVVQSQVQSYLLGHEIHSLVLLASIDMAIRCLN